MFLHLSVIQFKGGLPSHNAMEQAEPAPFSEGRPPPPPPPRYGQPSGGTYRAGTHTCQLIGV